jgi:sterol desaturase/sphingolipid hydroxylase (fatty acid hydroxylase superfamily)
MNGTHMLNVWLILFVVAGLASGIASGFFKARRIQPNGFKWKIFRHEILFATITISISGVMLGYLNKQLVAHGIIHFRHGPAPLWMIGLEYAGYFLLFDTYFYWLHRWMHVEPVYTWIHKLHHKSTSPNLLTTLSVNPLESVINGGFLPLFLSIFTIHDASMALMVPTNIILGLYVHSGHEFLPRWWNKSWATKWFISATFHDQHHRYFTGNFGGYTTIWDRLCGTMRPKFEADFDRLKARLSETAAPASPSEVQGR